MAYYRRWLRPLKVFDYFVQQAPGVTSLSDAEYQLFYAVMEGEVRARMASDFRPVTVAELRDFGSRGGAGPGPYDLPPDILLSIEDVKRVWHDRAAGREEASGEVEAPAKRHAGDEVRCRRWLETNMRAEPDAPWRKADAERVAHASFPGLSGAAFRRAWADAIKATGAQQWARPGRKS